MTVVSSKTWNAAADSTLLTAAPGETGEAFLRRSTSEDTVFLCIVGGAAVSQQNSGNGQAYYDTTVLGSNAYTVK